MMIAVVGDYASPLYKEFVKTVKIAKPEERIADLSVYTGAAVITNRKNRQFDISDSSMVVISSDYLRNVDARADVHHAQMIKKECYIYRDGRFLPFPEYAGTI